MITTFYPFSEVPFGKDLPPSELLSTPAFDELAHREVVGNYTGSGFLARAGYRR